MKISQLLFAIITFTVAKASIAAPDVDAVFARAEGIAKKHSAAICKEKGSQSMVEPVDGPGPSARKVNVYGCKNDQGFFVLFMEKKEKFSQVMFLAKKGTVEGVVPKAKLDEMARDYRKALGKMGCSVENAFDSGDTPFYATCSGKNFTVGSGYMSNN